MACSPAADSCERRRCSSLVRSTTGTHANLELVPVAFPSPEPSLQVTCPLSGLQGISLSVLVFSLPSFGCHEVWFHHFLSPVFSITVLFAPTGPPHGLSLFFSQRKLSVLKPLFRKAGRSSCFSKSQSEALLALLSSFRHAA